jgi:uncharacterized protein
MGVKDSFELAWNDWQGSAAFDRLDDEDLWASRWARAYVEFAAGENNWWNGRVGFAAMLVAPSTAQSE